MSVTQVSFRDKMLPSQPIFQEKFEGDAEHFFTALYETLVRSLYQAYIPSYEVSYDTLGYQEAFILKYTWELTIYFTFFVLGQRTGSFHGLPTLLLTEDALILDGPPD